MKVSENLLRGAIAVTAIIAFVTLFYLPSNGDSAPVPSSPQPVSQAPAWELRDVDGKTVRSSEFQDKVVLLDFWATWCGPCRAEIPGFIELQKKYEKEGLVVIGVSLDEQGPKVVKPFMRQMGINYPIVMGNQKMADAFGGILGIPTTFVIDRAGRIVNKHVGYTDRSQFEEEILPLLRNEKKI